MNFPKRLKCRRGFLLPDLAFLALNVISIPDDWMLTLHFEWPPNHARMIARVKIETISRTNQGEVTGQQKSPLQKTHLVQNTSLLHPQIG